MQPNPILDFLNSINLPYLETRQALANKYGIIEHPAYLWNVVEIKNSFIAGLIYPLSIQMFDDLPLDAPATYFSGQIYYHDDARYNFLQISEMFLSLFGVGKKSISNNIVGLEWKFGRTELSIAARPKDLQLYETTNTAHVRDPRLDFSCSVCIHTGYINPVTESEINEIQNANIVFEFEEPYNLFPQFYTVSDRLHDIARSYDLYKRTMFGKIGLNANKTKLIFDNGQLYIIPIATISGIRVWRLNKAKGLGGSEIEIVLKHYHPNKSIRTVTLCRNHYPDGLTNVATELSAATEIPMTLMPYQDDI